jgi:hypothetical protein
MIQDNHERLKEEENKQLNIGRASCYKPSVLELGPDYIIYWAIHGLLTSS